MYIPCTKYVYKSIFLAALNIIYICKTEKNALGANKSKL